jgi:hypothetical protein
MTNFDIGWIPAGWERGDDLQIVAAPPGGNGLIGRILHFPLGDLPHDECTYRFHYNEGDRVDAWLKWWGAAE